MALSSLNLYNTLDSARYTDLYIGKNEQKSTMDKCLESFVSEMYTIYFVKYERP